MSRFAPELMVNNETVRRLSAVRHRGSVRAMIDLRETIDNLAHGFLAANYPEATTIAEALGPICLVRPSRRCGLGMS